MAQKYEDSSDDREDVENDFSPCEGTDDSGDFFLRFKDGIPFLVRQDMMLDDLWLLVKKAIVSSQGLHEVPGMVLAKSAWHYNTKQTKMKVTILSKTEGIEAQASEYCYAYKAINLQSYQHLIDNLIEFRGLNNPYVDSILNIANSKAKFKVIRECDPALVE